jgi:hypothetical protein
MDSFGSGDRMKRSVEGEDRKHVMPLPECLDDWVAKDTLVRIIATFAEELQLGPQEPARPTCGGPFSACHWREMRQQLLLQSTTCRMERLR